MSNTGGIIGKVLDLQPIMSMKDTKGAVIAKKRGIRQVYKYYIEEFIKKVDYTESKALL